MTQELLGALAVLGFLAAAFRLAGAAWQAARRAAEAVMARELESARARRGDLTGLAEAEERKRATAQERRRAMALLIGWTVLLLAPALTPWTREIYAVYNVLWLKRPRVSRGVSVRWIKQDTP